ncbi:MAG: AtpZ/AtpI family protein [Chloroflexi bacterium]|nr:AtpZ/AtpI family protein [Chloroflexota bacterium]
MDKQPDSPPKKGTGQGQGDSGWQETAVILARISGIGWYVVGSIGAGIGAAWCLDRQFGTEPILLLIGLLLGVIAAFTGMIRLLSAFGRQRTRR